MARWIRLTGTNSWADLHRGGDDGRGGVRFDLSPCPTVSAMAGSLGGTARWRIEDDGAPEMAETFATNRNGKPHSFDDPAPTVQRHGIADERPTTSLSFADDGRPPAPADPEKPPYRVPLLSETHALPRNGLTVMSTFSGCGGSCLGFEMAGYKPLLAVEFVKSAVESYEANHPGVPVWSDDIRELTATKALKIMGLRKGELDVLEGSPPCESFSTAGIIAKGWGQERDYSDGKSQVMDDLFFEFTRLLGGIKPRAFVAENVSGLVKGASKGTFMKVHAELERQGYRVQARMLDAQWLGVPQRRQRVIFVGVRKDLKLDPAFPLPLQYRYSIRDALRGLEHERGAITDVRDRQYDGHDLGVDGPISTVVRAGASIKTTKGGHGGQYEVERLVYENGGTGGAAGHGRAEEDLDEPIRAITKSHGAAGHFQVEREPGEVVGISGGWPHREMSVDEPAATIGKGGYSAGQHEVERAAGDVVELRHPNRGYFRKNGPEYVVGDDEPAPTITKSGQAEYRVVREPDPVQDGQPLTGAYPAIWDGLGPDEADPEHHDLVRSDPEQPARTITRVGGASNRSSATHPDDPRKFSIPELRRLCGFPDDFTLTGSYAQQWERLGNSVPPPMMFHVAATLRDLLLTSGTRPAATTRRPAGRRAARTGPAADPDA